MAENINAEAMALLNRFIGYELLQKDINKKLMECHGIEIEIVWMADDKKFIKVKRGIRNFGRETKRVLHEMEEFSIGSYTIFQTIGDEQ